MGQLCPVAADGPPADQPAHALSEAAATVRPTPRLGRQPGGGGGYLGVLEHAQVRVHVEREVLVPAPLVQFGGLVELPLVGKHICQKQVIVGLSPLLPLLEKLEAQEMVSAAVAGSALHKRSPWLFPVKPLGLPTGTYAWLLGYCVSHLSFWWECLTTKADSPPPR